MTTIFLISGIVFHNDVKAQEWSAAQKEAWKFETDCWAAFAKSDVAGFLEFFHPDYMGWDDNSPLPNTKTDTQKWFQVFASGNKILVYDIKPVGIRVFGDFAIVHYYYSLVNEMDGPTTNNGNPKFIPLLRSQRLCAMRNILRVMVARYRFGERPFGDGFRQEMQS